MLIKYTLYQIYFVIFKQLEELHLIGDGLEIQGL